MTRPPDYEGDKSERLPGPRRLIWSLILLTLAYATLRHHVLLGEPWERLPLYTLNKALAWTGLLLLGITFGIRPWVKRFNKGGSWLSSRRLLGRAAFNLLGLHAVLTLLLLRTPYGGELIFRNGEVLAGGITGILLGSAALALLAWYYKRAGTKGVSHRLFRAAPVLLMVLALAHITLWGMSEWAQPGLWPAAAPPVTLLSGITALMALILMLPGRGKP